MPELLKGQLWHNFFVYLKLLETSKKALKQLSQLGNHLGGQVLSLAAFLKRSNLVQGQHAGENPISKRS